MKSIYFGAAVLAVAASANAAVLIDGFGTDLLAPLELPTDALSVSAGSMVTGAFDIRTTSLAPDSGTFPGRVRPVADIFEGVLTLSSPPKFDGFVSLIYSSFTGANLGGTLSIEVDFDYYDQAEDNPVSITVRLLSAGGQGTSTVSVLVPVTGGSVFVPVNTPDFNDVNFTAVTGMIIDINSGPSADYQIDLIRAADVVIPEPTALALVPVAGLVAMRRRRA